MKCESGKNCDDEREIYGGRIAINESVRAQSDQIAREFQRALITLPYPNQMFKTCTLYIGSWQIP